MRGTATSSLPWLGEVDLALSHYAEDVVFQPLVARPYHGRDGVAQQMSTWMSEFNDYRFEVDEYLDAGDEVVMLWCDGGVGKASGLGNSGRQQNATDRGRLGANFASQAQDGSSWQ